MNSSPLKIPKFSIGSWAFSFGPFESNPWSFEKVCHYASDAGYDGIEINGFRPHPHPGDFDSDAKCAELGLFLDDLGLGISGFAPNFGSLPPAEVPKTDYLAELDTSLRFCERMGINTLRVDTVSPPVGLASGEYDIKFTQLVDTWHAAAQACAAKNVTLVWEFEPGFWLNKPREVKNLVEAVNHPNFRLLFDTSHAYMGAVVGARHEGEKQILAGGVEEYARLVEQHIGHVHFIDSDANLHNDDTSVHAPFGSGLVDFPAVINALRGPLEKLEWWCFDFCFCPTTEADARKAIPFMKNAIKAANNEQ